MELAEARIIKQARNGIINRETVVTIFDILARQQAQINDLSKKLHLSSTREDAE